MTTLSGAGVQRLRDAVEWPDFTATRYEPLERIGRGGMGAVFRARDRELGREVAIKVSVLEAQADVERVRAEARTLASLEHPGIVPVHDAGVLPDGRAFYVMRLVRGVPLDAYLPSIPDIRDRARVFDRICDAIAFAHACGVIHRDLKPSNVMIGTYGDVLVLDWGLAGAAGSDAAPGGTHGYVAPEQLTGAADVRSDVYSLGAVLRDLLDDAGGGSRLRPLRSIVAVAMAADPSARYASATDLAADVRRYVDGLAVRAHKESVAERAARLARVYRMPLALVGAYLLMRIVLLFFSR